MRNILGQHNPAGFYTRKGTENKVGFVKGNAAVNWCHARHGDAGRNDAESPTVLSVTVVTN